MLGPSAGIGRQNHVEIETSKGVFQSSERWRLECYSRLVPSLSEIVSGSPKDLDAPNDRLVSTSIERPPRMAFCYPLLRGAGEKRVQLPSRELNSSSLVQSEQVVALPSRCTLPFQRVGLEPLHSIEDERHETENAVHSSR